MTNTDSTAVTVETFVTMRVPAVLTIQDGEITSARIGDVPPSEILSQVDEERVLTRARAKSAAMQADLDKRVAAAS